MVRSFCVLTYLLVAAHGLAPVIQFPPQPAALTFGAVKSKTASVHIGMPKSSKAVAGAGHVAPRLRGDLPMLPTRTDLDQAELMEIQSESEGQLHRPHELDVLDTLEQASSEVHFITRKSSQHASQLANATSASVLIWTFGLSVFVIMSAAGFWWRWRAQALRIKGLQTKMTVSSSKIWTELPKFAAAAFAGDTVEGDRKKAETSSTPSRDEEQGAESTAALGAGAESPIKAPTEIYPPHLRSIELKRGLKSRQYLQGELLMSKNTCYSGRVKSAGTEILVVGSLALNRAVNGDLVVVERLDDLQMEEYTESAKRMRHQVGDRSGFSEMEAIDEAAVIRDDESAARGRVVAIVERRNRELVGTILPPGESPKRGPDPSELEDDERIFVPPDLRYPFAIVKLPQDAEVDGKRVTVNMNQWDRFSEYPRGTWSSTLGDIGDVGTETKVLIKEHNIRDEPFSDEVTACLPPEDFRPSGGDYEGREDFSDKLVFSIDPPGCEDVDDALSFEKLENGNFRVGVHIADVSHFVRPGTAIDKEAAERCTSVYLADRRIDMLPSLLTSKVCSLRADGDARLTFSAIFELTSTAQIVDERFAKTVIKSRAQLSYEEAQNRLDGLADDGDQPEITDAIKGLNALATQFTAKRRAAGCLELASEEVSFELDDDTRLPSSVRPSERFTTCKLIEEFMLLANEAVARRLFNDFAEESVLRCHPPPKQQSMNELSQLLVCHGVRSFDWKTGKALSKSLDRISKPDDPFFNRLVRFLTVRCMNEAQYLRSGAVEPDKLAHFGLATPLYTHFTSPIRRYADVLVHRELEAALLEQEVPEEFEESAALEVQMEKLNYRNRMARYASMSSNELHMYLYFKANGPATTEGVVTRISRTGIHVACEEFGTEGVVVMGELDWLVLQDRQTAHGRPRSQYEGLTVGIFDRIIVRIEADLKDGRFRHLLFSFKGLPQKPMGISSKDNISMLVSG